jgi:predicted AAA+ superfamily ATPase
MKHVGGLLEGFVATELLKQRTWSQVRFALHHFRDRDGGEVDMVVEAARGDLIGIEVKAAKTVRANDFRGLELVRDRSGPEFRAGILLHLGAQTFSFGDRLWSVPLDALWGP